MNSIIHDNILLDKKAVEKLFAEAVNPEDYMEGLLRMIYPDFDKVAKIDGYPKANKATCEWLCRLCIEADNRIMDERKLPWHSSKRWFAGGYWLNWGFSEDRDLLDRVISPAAVTFKSSAELREAVA